MKIQSKNKQGFTLIELLITISIMGVLATVVTVGFPSAQKLARDNTRKSDLKQYQTALENYASRSSGMLYPSGARNPSTMCSTLGITGSCPNDPKAPTYQYSYAADSSATTYVLWAYMEKTGQYFILCSSGKAGTVAAPRGSNCPL